MIRVSINKDQKEELEKIRSTASNKNSEKALMVLLSAEGMSVAQISQQLKRHPHTIRDWLKRYNSNGINGLNRNYSPGRPAQKRIETEDHIEKIINSSPIKQGYREHVWSVPLITHHINIKLSQKISQDTVKRALKKLGYVYKRPSKSVPARAPSKEEKQKRIESIIKEIKKLMKESDTEIYTLDESHFSTEPYIVQGWFKKRAPAQNRIELQTRERYNLWIIKSKNKEILLETI